MKNTPTPFLAIVLVTLASVSCLLRAADPASFASASARRANPAKGAARSSAPASGWQSPARLHAMPRSIPGTFRVEAEAVEFSSPKGFSRRWPFVEIQTLDLWPRRIVLTGYEKRGRLRSGTRRFQFDLEVKLPPTVAVELAQRVGRPLRNGVPQPEVAGCTEIPGRQRTAFGGSKSNGVLRFCKEGMDYLTETARESRSWSWTDIRTLSNPDTFHLILFGYRDTYSFDLKQPLARELFDRLSDAIYAHNLGDGRPGRKNP